MKFLKVLMTFALSVSLIALASLAQAKYPRKAVTLIVPYGPGGAADLAGRNLSSYMSKYFDKNLVVVNKAGAAGVVGSTYVSKGKKDGYSLLISRVGCNAAVPAINKKISYKWDEFTFLGLLEINPFVLSVNVDSPYKTFEDLKQAIQNKEELSYSSAGVGNLQHLGMVLLLDELGLPQDSIRHIPFKGGGKAAAAAVGGHVTMFFQNSSGVIGHIDSGKLRPLAVTTSERAANLPDVPTFRELGYENMETILGWTGLWGPPELPKEVVETWTAGLKKLSTDPAWIKATEDLGSTPQILDPEKTKKFVEGQYNLFHNLVTKLGLVIK